MTLGSFVFTVTAHMLYVCCTYAARLSRVSTARKPSQTALLHAFRRVVLHTRKAVTLPGETRGALFRLLWIPAPWTNLEMMAEKSERGFKGLKINRRVNCSWL